ncbi:MAG: NTP transferase domain-containing protein [Paludibacteraceae bacterium]|nr:NTP transferase domain-containing protein [Paludibacteraceae bacterium]
MKGIILAGGSATRLYPLSKAISKQIMPVYDKPMIYYPLSTLMLAGIREVLIISTPRDLPMFEELLGDGSRLGMRFAYKVQEVPNGLAQAFVLGAEFLNGEPGCLILGDNLFYGQGFTKMLRQAVLSLDPLHDMPEQQNPAHKHATTMEDLKSRIMHLGRGACIFGYEVSDPRAYGVVEFDKDGKVLSLEEKPQQPKSNYAVPGLYFYDKTVCAKAAALKPSARGEYEITDLNRVYLEEGTLHVQLFGRGFAWLDTGNCDSLLEAGNFVATIQNRQGFYVACIEEIAWRNGWITTDALRALGSEMKTQYGRYLERLAGKKTVE